MGSHPSHRGLGPQDERLFAARHLPALRSAASDVCWLLDRNYASRSAVEMVGNRYALTSRQRMAVSRHACSRREAEQRARLCVEPAQLRGKELWLDGYNVLTVLESALSGGIILLGRDGCCRDIAGIHRRYRKVSETVPVLRLVGEMTASWGVTLCRWWLDQPVSNSGRLKVLILEVARSQGWPMEAELTFSPDHVLSHTEEVIATSDGVVLDHCQRWVNLTRLIIAGRIHEARLLDLSAPTD